MKPFDKNMDWTICRDVLPVWECNACFRIAEPDDWRTNHMRCRRCGHPAPHPVDYEHEDKMDD